MVKVLVVCGYVVVCFNFRGVGWFEGVYDGGLGEVGDLFEVIWYCW